MAVPSRFGNVTGGISLPLPTSSSIEPQLCTTSPAPCPLLAFYSSNLMNDVSQFGIARKTPNVFLLILARGYGMAETRIWAILNVSTGSVSPLALSEKGRPLIWLDSSLDRHDPINVIAPEETLVASGLLAAESPIIRPTGRTQ